MTEIRESSEIQEAHDILVQIAIGELDLGEELAQNPGLRGALDALCWVLQHDHNSTFEENFGRIRASAEQLGYVLLARNEEDEEPEPADGRRCRICGCTTARACPGGCWWVTPDLCSQCAPFGALMLLPSGMGGSR